MLEAQAHQAPFFVTYTYEIEPEGRNLLKEQLSASIHRLRAAVARRDRGNIRFYACGEYGDDFGRPHYHAAIYGLKPADKTPDSSRPGRFTSPIIESSWRGPHGPAAGVGGSVDVGDLTPESAAYITGYITKKLVSSKSISRLDGRNPEFAVMSRRPGIGSVALPSLIEALNTSHGALYLARHGDVPVVFQVGTRLLPLGTFMRSALRSFFFGDPSQPKLAKEIHNRKFHENIQAHLPPLRLDADLGTKMEAWYEAQAESRDAYFASRRQKKVKLAHRHKLNQSRKTL